MAGDAVVGGGLDPLRLERLLIYGTPETRRVLAVRLRAPGAERCRVMLAETVRSSESWLLRARCLEVLGIAAAYGDRGCAEAILELLVPGRAR